MAMINSHSASLSPISNPWKELMLDWSVIFLVLLSMMIQIVLVFGGAIRHRSGSRWLNFTVWVCYMGADFVATSALGSMIHYSSGARVYAIWACVVIVHLGGSDTITAYSVPDSNLWRRHCFNMLYQGSIAAYVVYASAVQGRAEIQRYLMAACSLIFIVGISKYVERALALWLASPSQIVSSVQSIHNFMKMEHALGLEIDDRVTDDEIADVDKFRNMHEAISDEACDEDSIHYQYIVTGEQSFNEDDDKDKWSESIVTIKDVWEHEGEEVTDNYLLCVSHALFKMYKRRFASLRFHEGGLRKTKRFFTAWRFSNIQVFNIVEMELKFMYDYLFSKSSGTAFSAWGVGMRAVNICVLGLCWYLIVRVLQETEDVLHGQRIVKYIVMSVAVGLEVFQLERIVVSDWSMVWLICANIRQSRKVGERWWWWGRCSVKVMGGVAKVVGRVRKAVGGKYWQNQIPQLCIMESCFSAARSYSYPFMMRIIGLLPFSESIQGWYIRAVLACHIKREIPDDPLKDSCLEYATKWARNVHQELAFVKGMLSDEEEGVGWEHVILGWHVATTIKERLHDHESHERVEDISIAVRLSRYFAYLVVTWPEVLAVDAENAKGLYKEVWVEMMGHIQKHNGTDDDFCTNLKGDDFADMSGSRSRGASIVLRKAKEEVDSDWSHWASRWLGMLYTMGMQDKSGEHGERVTEGGEWMSMVWVVMGHTGMAEESYNPTAMKTDPIQYQFHQ